MQNDDSRLVTIPNLLTLIRILLVPVFAIAFYAYPEQRYISLGIFTLASLTDGVDGYLARKLHQISSFGKLIDPLALPFQGLFPDCRNMSTIRSASPGF